ncbi:MAG: ParB/RepB/Spo0J family partition protein [Clostridiaceae bacterium]|jgi:ParB family chromosome partitioning protein|nr:ParB/RepB/Spo0J family partition protein [Clostridiaceae bacterium]
MKDTAKGLQDFIRMQHGEGAVVLPIDKVEPNPDQPRKSFNDESLRELSSSITKVGVIQPIIVYPNGDKYIIIAGERRYRAARLAGLKEIPVVIRPNMPAENQQIALIENLQREDLNPIESAEAISDLIENYKLTQEEVASALGKSRPVVTNLLRLLVLPTEVMQMVRDGQLSSSHARCLVVIDDKEILTQFAKHAVENKLSVHDLEVSVKMFFARKKAAAVERPKNIQSRELKDLVADMKRIFATKVRVVGNDRKGRIYIDYFTQDDLQRIFELMEILKVRR